MDHLLLEFLAKRNSGHRPHHELCHCHVWWISRPGHVLLYLQGQVQLRWPSRAYARLEGETRLDIRKRPDCGLIWDMAQIDIQNAHQMRVVAVIPS